MARIKTIGQKEAGGRLKEIYDDLIQKRGKLADVHTIQSLRPESIKAHMDLYLEIMFSRSELSRSEREMMAVVVSANNMCTYCISHHSEALKHYWKSEEKIKALIRDFKKSPSLSPKEKALCRFAQELSKSPGNFKDDQSLDEIKRQGLSDEAILDATLVVSYFNFVNRIVLALGLETSEEEQGGYSY